jgi:hypothetical protein
MARSGAGRTLAAKGVTRFKSSTAVPAVFTRMLDTSTASSH